MTLNAARSGRHATTDHQSAGSQHDATAASGCASGGNPYHHKSPQRLLDQMAKAKYRLRMLQCADSRRSDVRLCTGDALEWSGQRANYPVWEWSPLQSYRWRTSGHINVLELLAFCAYVRHATWKNVLRQSRCVHISDSLVCAVVVAKGRSSSVPWDRVCRRVKSSKKPLTPSFSHL